MPLNALGNYVLPAGTLAVTSTVVASASYNAFLNDLQSVLNTVRTVPQGGTGGNSVSTAQGSLGLRPGIDIQPYNLNLNAFARLTGSANKISYFNGQNSLALADFTATGRDIVASASLNALRQALGVPTNAETMLVSNIGFGANNYLRLDSNGKLPQSVVAESPQSGFPDAVLYERTGQGANSGSLLAGTDNVRVFSRKNDPNNTVSLNTSTGRFTPTKDGYITVKATAYLVNVNKLYLFNVTDNRIETSFIGLSTTANNNISVVSTAEGQGEVVGGKTYAIIHRCQASRSNIGKGLATNLGGDEFYAILTYHQKNGA